MHEMKVRFEKQRFLLPESPLSCARAVRKKDEIIENFTRTLPERGTGRLPRGGCRAGSKVGFSVDVFLFAYHCVGSPYMWQVAPFDADCFKV